MLLKKCLTTFLMLLISVFVAISCGGKKAEEGVLNLRVGPEPKTIDPTLNASVDGALYITHIFEGLTARDKENKITEGVAEKWDISSDKLKYTFYLRTNAKWSDGKIITTKDFVYSWRRAVDPKVASQYSFQLENIKNAKAIIKGDMPKETLAVKAIDDYTLEVILETPTAYFLELTAYPTLSPLREDIVEADPEGWTLKPETYIGNGPFKMTERSTDDKIVMEQNEFYHNIASIVPKKLIFVLMDNPTAHVAGIKEGSLQFSSGIPAKDIPRLREEGILETKPSLATYFYVINVTNQVLKDVRIRKALSLVIDRNYIIDTVLKAGQRPAGAWVPYGITLEDGDFRENGGDYYSVKKEDYQKNVEEAKRLLAEAGYPDGNGFPVLQFKSNQGGGNLEIFEPIQQMWKETLGIDITVSAEEWAVFQQTRLDKNFDIAMHNWAGDYNDPMTFFGIFLSYTDLNYGGYKNTEFDKNIEESSIARNNSERVKYLHEAERILINDMPLIPIYFTTSSYLVNPKLKGVVYDTLGMNRFFYAYMEE